MVINAGHPASKLQLTKEYVMNNTTFQRLIGTQAGWGPLALRLAAGIIFVAHGAQKLFGWFGGHGLEGTAGWMASIGLEPGLPMAVLAGSAEFFGGLALIVGFLVRPAAFVLSITMLVAIFAVHWSNGLFMANNGYEFALSLLAIGISLFVSGGGKVSVDDYLTAVDSV